MPFVRNIDNNGIISNNGIELCSVIHMIMKYITYSLPFLFALAIVVVAGLPLFQDLSHKYPGPTDFNTIEIGIYI